MANILKSPKDDVITFTKQVTKPATFFSKIDLYSLFCDQTGAETRNVISLATDILSQK